MRERERVFCVPLLPTVILSKIRTFSTKILLEPNSVKSRLGAVYRRSHVASPGSPYRRDCIQGCHKFKLTPFWIRPNSNLSITKGLNIFQTVISVRYSISTMDYHQSAFKKKSLGTRILFALGFPLQTSLSNRRFQSISSTDNRSPVFLISSSHFMHYFFYCF